MNKQKKKTKKNNTVFTFIPSIKVRIKSFRTLNRVIVIYHVTRNNRLSRLKSMISQWCNCEKKKKFSPRYSIRRKNGSVAIIIQKHEINSMAETKKVYTRWYVSIALRTLYLRAFIVVSSDMKTYELHRHSVANIQQYSAAPSKQSGKLTVSCPLRLFFNCACYQGTTVVVDFIFHARLNRVPVDEFPVKHARTIKINRRPAS